MCSITFITKLYFKPSIILEEELREKEWEDKGYIPIMYLLCIL
jgi:hypothetical protein